MSFRATYSLFVFSLSVAFASGAGAQGRAEPSADAEARKLFEQGRAAYQEELFTEAEDAFRAAYEAMPEEDPRRSLILANVAQAIERQGGRDEDALEAWRNFEREARGDAGDGALLRASQRIRELEARLARRRQEEPEPVSLELDEADAAAEGDGRRPHWSGIALTSAGGAMILVGGITGILALTKRSSTLDRCEGTQCPEDALADSRRVDKLALSSDVLLWPGLALAAAGAVMMIKLDAGKDGRVSASCGATGCMLTGRF